MAREIEGDESRRRIILNPEEPRAGDFGFMLLRKADPIHGDAETRNYLRSQLRGLRGKEITVRLNGWSINENGDRSRFHDLERTFVLNRYNDLFGPEGAYDSMLYEGFRQADDSNDTVIASTLIIYVD